MQFTFEQEKRLETCKVMAVGLCMALVMLTPLFSMIYDKNWNWARGFPIGWIGVSLDYMNTFFHELGHALLFWFYGYVALPHFDFNYGGGMTAAITGQLIFLHLVLYALLAYLFVQLKDHKNWQILCVCIAVFHLATAHIEFHKVVCVFAGPLAQSVMGGFLLARAWFNIAPRGVFERFLNAAFGFGMLFSVLINAWALLHDDVWRLVYFEQKGQHGFGDLDRVADMLDIRFSFVIWTWLLSSATALVLPILLYLRRSYFLNDTTN